MCMNSFFKINFYLFQKVAAPNPHDLVRRENVQKALAADEGPTAKLISFQMKDFTSKGDNYLCIVTKVEVVYEKNGQQQLTSYVVKLNPLVPMPNLEHLARVLFEKEIGFYKEIVPLLNKELERLQLGTLGIPKYFHSVSQEKEQVIFLEDLRTRDFKMLDRKVGMDRNHTMLIMKELAKLHAISVVLMNNEEFKRENLEKKFPFLGEPYVKMIENTSNGNIVNEFYGQSMATAAEIFDKIEGYEEGGRFLRSIIPTCSDVMINALKSEEPFVTFCHGDCWNNNFLFK